MSAGLRAREADNDKINNDASSGEWKRERERERETETARAVMHSYIDPKTSGLLSLDRAGVQPSDF